MDNYGMIITVGSIEEIPTISTRGQVYLVRPKIEVAIKNNILPDMNNDNIYRMFVFTSSTEMQELYFETDFN